MCCVMIEAPAWARGQNFAVGLVRSGNGANRGLEAELVAFDPDADARRLGGPMSQHPDPSE